MREILFRAKTNKNGKWVEGLLWKKKYNSNNIYISYFPDKDDHEDVFCVNPETVCQYTGLSDRNGTNIFESDIVSISNSEDIGIVKYGLYDNKHLGFYIEWTGACHLYRQDIYYWAKNCLIKIVGNIFDNPELIRKESEV